MAVDVDRDEALPLTSLPPRRLSGLRDFFDAHELQVNDVLEIRVAGGALRLACVRTVRPAREEGEGARTERERAANTAPATATAARPASASPFEAPRPSRRDPAVVERIGSVTVRRLGSTAFASPPEASLPRDADLPGSTEGGAPARDAAGAARGAAPGEAARPPAIAARGKADDVLLADAAHDGRLDEAPARGEVREGSARPADPAHEGTGEREAAPGREARQVGLFAQAPSDARTAGAPRGAPGGSSSRGPTRAPAPRPGPARAELADVQESDLLDDPGARPMARTVRDGPALPWFRRGTRPAPEEEGRHRPSDRPDEAGAAGEAQGPRSSAEAGSPSAVGEERSGPSRPAARRPAAPPAGVARAADARRPGGRREREEALSRAGDLRSRIVRWLLDPSTPVIVQDEAVQERFDLSPDVARDVLAGILESPPPSLRLTVLREGMIRVSRVTVVQEA